MPEGEYLLGIDIGGTGAKAGLFTVCGKLLNTGYSEYRMINTVPGQAEHDANQWWDSTIFAIRQAIAGYDPGKILAVGVGCTNGLIAVDREGNPLRSAVMLWDQRSLPQVDVIRQALGAEQVFNVTGNPVAPGAYSLPTILWLKQEEPRIFESAHKLLVPGGFIVAKLTGEFTIDHSRACTTLLFDIRQKEWHLPFIEALELPIEKLPAPLPSTDIAGEVTRAAAEVTGLLPGTPVIAGCMDTIGASIGAGSFSPQECFIIMGTAARVATCVDRPDFDPRFMNCTHTVLNTWLTIGAINGVGSSLKWIRDNFGQLESQAAKLMRGDEYDLITEQALHSPPGSKALLYLPYISGERTPIWDPYARAVFLGVTLGHDRSDLIRSVLEGTAFAIRHTIEILENERGVNIVDLRLVGTAAKSRIWSQIIADVLGKRVVSVTKSNAEVLGAAMLAGQGVNAISDFRSAVKKAVETGRVYEPDNEAHFAYDQLFPLYKDLYPALKPFFERQAKLNMVKAWITKGDARE